MAHRDAVWAVAFVDDEGRRAVSGAADGSVLLWNLERGEVERALEGQHAAVRSVAIVGRQPLTNASDALRTSHGGALSVAAVPGKVACGYFDGSLVSWDPSSFETLGTLVGHGGPVQSLAAVGDERLLSGSRDRTVRIWDHREARELATLRGHEHWVSRVAVADDRRVALSAGEDGAVVLWDLEQRCEIRRMTIGPQPIWGATLSPDGRIACAGAPDGAIFVWDARDGRELARLESGSGGLAPRALAISADSRRLLAGCDDSSLSLFDLETLRPLRRMQGEARGVNTLAIADDARIVLFGHVTGALALSAGPPVDGHRHFVFSLRLSPDGTRALSAGLDGEVRVTDLASGRTLARLAHEFPVFSVHLFDDGRRAISCGGPCFRIWDLERYVEVASARAGRDDAVHTFAAPCADGARVLFGGEEPRLSLWSTATGTRLATIELDSDLVSCLAVDPNADRAVAGFAHGHLAWIDLARGKILRTISAHEDWVRDVRLLGGGRRVVSLAQDRTLRIHELETGAEIAHPLRGRPIAALSVAPDGRLDAIDVHGMLSFDLGAAS